MKKTTFRIILTLAVAIMLLLCLADMPYGYYELVRLVAAVVFAYFAYEGVRAHRDAHLFVFGALALLFQPFVKVALGRTMWNIVDVVVAVGLIALLVKGWGGKK